MYRYFIALGYNGTNYCGWQVQPNGNTVQAEIEKALSTLYRRNIEIVGAGRTDAGVHASKMFAHFDMEEPLPDPAALSERLNRMLPQDIVIYSVQAVQPEAHARFDATAREYKYYVTLRKDPFRNNLTCRINGELDMERMNQAAEKLFSYIDFTSFSKLHTDVKTNNCTIMYARWELEGDVYVFTIKANRFLRNMVRAIVGTLLEVGKGKLSVDDFCRIIEMKDRGKAGTSVPGKALFLVDVEYPESIYLDEQ
ncbi:MAG: tRNA pseudouridine(38-40) synthase TruA [Bacteroidales bacterium]